MNTQHLLTMAALAGTLAASAMAQAPIAFYRSGSTGADGPFNPTVTTPGTNLVVSGVPADTKVLAGTIAGTAVHFIDVPLRTNGLYNFTTITIPKNMRVRFLLNSNQLDNPPPVIMLATGDILIAGEISVTSMDTACAYHNTYVAEPYQDQGYADTWIPGPGGYRGGKQAREPGMGSYQGIYGSSGTYSSSAREESFCLPLVGGSGGAFSIDYGMAGCGGSGAIYLASSGRIIFDGDTGATGRGIIFRYSGTGHWPELPT